jgi:CubicO group peptidase (beta-lactamase class C family)
MTLQSPFKIHLALVLLISAVMALATSSLLQAQSGPPPEVRAAIRSVEEMLAASGLKSMQTFADSQLAPAYRQSFDNAQLQTHFEKLRAAAKGALGDAMVELRGDGLHLILQADQRAEYLLKLDDSGKITALDVISSGVAREEPLPALGWPMLADTFSAMAAQGFSGVVLAVRDGEEVLRQGYGSADTVSGRQISLEHIFGIGSTPIDFTVSSTLLLDERGLLSLDDPITRFFDQVPADRARMTLRHLLTGRSGLPNFHDNADDWDPDLAWVDRDSAVKRILALPLLFKPGEGQEHSHSAFGLLAAIVEKVSGVTYREFVRAEILDKLGMARTGFYGEAGEFKVSDFAVGRGATSVGVPNIPPNWGPTSWLVMGSGGMYSTLDDMNRYYQALEAGTLFGTDEARSWQRKPGLDVGGSDRGYFIVHVSDGKASHVLLLSNSEGRSDQMRQLIQRLAELVLPKPSH